MSGSDASGTVDLASAASHALAGPVAVIAGFAHLIGSRGMEEQVRAEAAASIVAAAHRLLQVHEDVLAVLAAAVGGEQRGRTTTAARLVRDAFGLTQRGSGGSIRPVVTGKGSAAVPGDVLVMRALANLIVAACEGRELPLDLPVDIAVGEEGLVVIEVLLGQAPPRSDRWTLSLGAAEYILRRIEARADVVTRDGRCCLRLVVPGVLPASPAKASPEPRSARAVR